ncbi:MAG: HEAT repeat domain-containing protein [Deltaproteobacteria bacterium]|nr:HEAT repeat domain-containing protein [Deltaproteobacteria bacterium]
MARFRRAGVRRAWAFPIALLVGACVCAFGCAKKEFFQEDESWFDTEATPEPPVELPFTADVPSQTRALADPRDTVRADAARALAMTGGPARSSLPALGKVAANQEESVAVRVSAIDAMAAIGPWHETVVPTLDALAKGGEPRVRLAAVRALGAMDSEAAPAAPTLVALLTEIELRDESVDALVRIGPAAVPALSKAADHPNADVRGAAQVALARIGTPSVAALVQKLKDPRDYEGTVRALAAVGKGAIPDLEKALADRNDNLRRGAADALAIMGPTARPASAAIVKTTNDPSASVRTASQYALARIGPRTGPEVRAVIWGLRDSDVRVRKAAGLGIENLAPDAESPAVEEIAKALSDHRWNVRADCATALGRIGENAGAATPSLVRALDDSDPNVRERAARSLGSIGLTATSALDALRARTKDPHPDVRRAAIEAIAKIEESAR